MPVYPGAQKSPLHSLPAPRACRSGHPVGPFKIWGGAVFPVATYYPSRGKWVGGAEVAGVSTSTRAACGAGVRAREICTKVGYWLVACGLESCSVRAGAFLFWKFLRSRQHLDPTQSHRTRLN